MSSWLAWALSELLLFGAMASALVGCRVQRNEVVPYTSVDQIFSEPIFREFEKREGVLVRAVFDTEETKSTGVLNRLIAEAAHPQADVFWSGDPVRPFLLIRRGLVEPYHSPEAAAISKPFRAEDGTWTGFAARARVLLLNTDRVAGRELPRSILDFTAPQWKGQAAIANPLFGTMTMHAAALFAAWGDSEAQAFFRSLRENDVRVASSNGEVKRLVVAGEVAFGLTDTDDANQALKAAGDKVRIVYPDQDGMGTLVMPTTLVVIKGGPNPKEARRLVDFLLSSKVEAEMARRGAHMPLRTDVPAPPGVNSVSEVRAMGVDYSHLGEVMERIQPWLRQWAGL